MGAKKRTMWWEAARISRHPQVREARHALLGSCQVHAGAISGEEGRDRNHCIVMRHKIGDSNNVRQETNGARNGAKRESGQKASVAIARTRRGPNHSRTTSGKRASGI